MELGAERILAAMIAAIVTTTAATTVSFHFRLSYYYFGVIGNREIRLPPIEKFPVALDRDIFG